MCRLFESLKLIDGVLQNIAYHNERFNRSRFDIFKLSDTLSLAEIITIPEDAKQGLVKCKLIYGKEIDRIEFSRYSKKIINTLKLVYDESLQYAYKYTDRSSIEKNCVSNEKDDILIIQNGKVTDTSFSNVAFFDGEKWHTPKRPLLKGTKREQLLHDKIIFEKEIYVDDIPNYKGVCLINAMLEIDKSNMIPVKNIT